MRAKKGLPQFSTAHILRLSPRASGGNAYAFHFERCLTPFHYYAKLLRGMSAPTARIINQPALQISINRTEVGVARYRPYKWVWLTQWHWQFDDCRGRRRRLLLETAKRFATTATSSEQVRWIGSQVCRPCDQHLDLQVRRLILNRCCRLCPNAVSLRCWQSADLIYYKI